MMPDEKTMDKFFLEIKKRVEKICKLCPHSSFLNCNLLKMSLGAAAISADCPFEDLTGDESIDVIIEVIENWKIDKVIGSFSQEDKL